MLKGAHLSLLIGPAVPLPAPQTVVEALKSVQVTHSRERNGFQLTFGVGKTSIIQTALLPSGFFDPIVTRVVIIVTMTGMPTVLMDGIVTRQELSPSNQAGESTLTITGEDLSVLMDVVEMKLAYPAMPDVAQIITILAKYAVFGIQPRVISPLISPVPRPTERIPMQTGTDLAYIKNIAAQCGYVFYIDPGPLPLTSTAYFGPDAPIPIPQPALSVNNDWDTNVESLSFSLDGLAKKVFVITVLDPVTKKIPIPLPVPNISLLHPPLGLRLTAPAKVQFPENLANLSPEEAAKRALGLMFNNSDAVTGSGSLDVSRYGQILKARMLVGVRGAGVTYDGLYYVNSVTHDIQPGRYRQSFSISRDGLITQTPVVVP